MKSWKPWVGALVLLVLAGGWWARRDPETSSDRGNAAHASLLVVDRVTGRPVPEALWTLLATGTSGSEEVFDQGVTPAVPSVVALAKARRMAVGAYGYEVRLLEPEALASLGGRIDLEPVVAPAALSLETDDETVTSSAATLMVSARDPEGATTAAPVWWVHRELLLTRETLPVPVGRGQLAQALPPLGDDAHVYWPFPAPLAAGRPTVVHVERTRRIVFGPANAPSGASVPFGWVHVDPRRLAELGHERRTGLAAHMGQDGYEAAPTSSGMGFAHLPRVPLTGVAHTAAGWFALELDAEAVTLPLPLDGAPLRRLTSVTIDGAPPPEGAVILPGALADDLVNGVLARGWLDLGGLGLRAPKPDAWLETSLPAATSLTVWHRDQGLARLAWAESGVAVGAWEPGLVYLRRHPACRARATVSVRSGCVGSPLVSSGTSRVDGMERPVGATGASLLGGIPFGPVAVEVRTWRDGAKQPEVLRRQVSIDASSPCARFSIAEDGSVTYESTGSVPPDAR